MRINFKRYALYLLRWQASTPILAGVGILLAAMGQIVAADCCKPDRRIDLFLG